MEWRWAMWLDSWARMAASSPAGVCPRRNGAQEGERSDFLPCADERIVAGPGNFGAAPQPADADDLPYHDAGDQGRSQQIKPQTETFGRYGETSALVGKHFARPDGEVGRDGG